MDSLIAGSGKDGEKGVGKPPSREAKGAGALVAAGRPGDKKPPAPAQTDLPDGLLTAGSFDDNLYPGPFRTFLKKIGRAQSAQNISDRFLGYRLVVTVKNGDGRPVGNARVQVRSEDGGPAVTLRTRTDGRAVFISSWDEVPADGDFAVTVTPPSARLLRGVALCVAWGTLTAAAVLLAPGCSSKGPDTEKPAPPDPIRPAPLVGRGRTRRRLPHTVLPRG